MELFLIFKTLRAVHRLVQENKKNIRFENKDVLKVSNRPNTGSATKICKQKRQETLFISIKKVIQSNQFKNMFQN